MEEKKKLTIQEILKLLGKNTSMEIKILTP